ARNSNPRPSSNASILGAASRDDRVKHGRSQHHVGAVRLPAGTRRESRACTVLRSSHSIVQRRANSRFTSLKPEHRKLIEDHSSGRFTTMRSDFFERKEPKPETTTRERFSL